MSKTHRSLSLVAGENLRHLIQKSNRTQEQFAFEFGANDRTVRRWIKNGINSLSIIEEVARFFGVDVETIFL
jgi:transcriptional regulator with XRE-family HTH domain